MTMIGDQYDDHFLDRSLIHPTVEALLPPTICATVPRDLVHLIDFIKFWSFDYYTNTPRQPDLHQIISPDGHNMITKLWSFHHQPSSGLIIIGGSKPDTDN